MEKQTLRFGIAFGTATMLVTLTAGCATKNFVRNNIEPIETRLGKVEETGSENSRRITEVDQNSQAGITDAKSRAAAAAEGASNADKRAQGAEALAQKGLEETGQIREEVRNADNFQLLKAETVRFGFDKSELDEVATHALDALVSAAQSSKKYVIEVQGFADRVGPEEYNLNLSRRRADAVVRYLTLVHKIPLARVFEVGYGEQEPVAPNESREGREQNRRVEIRLLAVQQASSGDTVQAQSNKPGQE